MFCQIFSRRLKLIPIWGIWGRIKRKKFRRRKRRALGTSWRTFGGGL
jgi:hypothetical protein